jgi:DNA replication and repair protein RecF
LLSSTLQPNGAVSVVFSSASRASYRTSVERLMLTSFRCHRALRLETGPDAVVLTGRNGSGKTSILEALSLLSPGRGLRRARLEEMALRDAGECAGNWAVAVRLRGRDGSVDVGTGCQPGPGGGERRRVRIAGEPARRQDDLGAVAGVLWLTPEMDRLFTDGAGGRRRFLDRLIFGADPSHAGRVAAYDRALAERARLLRDGPADPVWLAAIEDQIARQGVAIAVARTLLAERLSALATDAAPFPAATIAVDGAIEDWLAAMPALAAEDRVRATLAASRGLDAETGRTACGPHRSEVTVRDAATGRPARDCSTGEQKALLIALVLAAARLQRRETGSAPLLLLDEVAAHLDPFRRAELFAAVDRLDAQAWYAGTDAEVFAPLAGRAQFFTIGAPGLGPAVRAQPVG